MLQTLTRLQAWVLLAALVALCAWSATLGSGPSPNPAATPPATYSDVRLYHDVAAAVASGDDYYSAAVRLHRLHEFPTQPFFTVRLPTLAWLGAAVGWRALQAALAGLLVATSVAWFARLDRRASTPAALGAALTVLTGGAMITQPDLVVQHDLWAGILITLALALRGTRAWPLTILCVALAVAIRELATAFAFVSLACAVWERRWREVWSWLALIAAFAAVMSEHAVAVRAHVHAGDLHSQGWDGLRGPAGMIGDLITVSVLNATPRTLAGPLAVLGLFGWCGAPRHIALPVLLWLTGFGLAIALFARTDNLYWAIELLPAWFIGFASLPRAISQLVHALAARPAHVAQPAA